MPEYPEPECTRACDRLNLLAVGERLPDVLYGGLASAPHLSQEILTGTIDLRSGGVADRLTTAGRDPVPVS